ncbi:glycerophosphodiester phosphodiesterase [Brachybacterium avium]|uniref:Glycerophosphodiester phosphodiesterase n=1 Tax=Brachybacterium avium TaxID=2017485 RepID=A0A220UDV6_9MICO|nr:glycerophosphodiester phosphodiesterase family protein [Brachybacterium avium]ASK65903.1 glycerophosphodiester phosphodiesterase [Brachybacterium avium]
MRSTDPGPDTASGELLIVGHRGAMTHALENTLASFQLAEQMGCRELELDLRRSADDRIVVIHDGTLDRLAGDEDGRGLGPVADMTLEEIQRVPLRDGHRLHTFEEVCAATTAGLEVEIKDPAVVPLLARFLEARPEVVRRMRLTSFRAEALVQARELLPQIPRGMIVHRLPVGEKHPEGLDALLERTAASALLCGWKGLTADAVAAQHAAGRRVHGWPLRTAEQMAHAIAIGVDGTTVDDPQAAFEWYRQALAAQG